MDYEGAFHCDKSLVLHDHMCKPGNMKSQPCFNEMQEFHIVMNQLIKLTFPKPNSSEASITVEP